MKLTHIFYSPSEMRPMDSYFSGIAGLAQPLQPILKIDPNHNH